jgi:hypothetical protein
VTSGAVCLTASPFCGTVINGQPVTTTVSFNAQGIFGFAGNPGTDKFRDVTNHCSTNWFPVAAEPPNFPGAISYIGNGQFIGLTAGCTFFTVSDGGFLQTIVVGVDVDPGTCPPLPAGILAPHAATDLSLSRGLGAAGESPGNCPSVR